MILIRGGGPALRPAIHLARALSWIRFFKNWGSPVSVFAKMCSERELSSMCNVYKHMTILMTLKINQDPKLA